MLKERFFRGTLSKPNCSGCPFESQTKVPPEGNLHAEVMLVGEGPGAEEIQQGRPFIGKSGRALDRTLEHLGAKREELWITNATLCMPQTIRRPSTRKCTKCKGKGTYKRATCELCKGDGSLQFTEVLNPKQALSIAADYCKERLLHEIGAIRPNVVVPLGGHALTTLIGKNSGIIEHRGAIHTGEVPKLTYSDQDLYALAGEAALVAREVEL